MWANADLAAEIESRQSAQAELVKAKDEAVSANKIKSNFLANMSHEIRVSARARESGRGSVVKPPVRNDLL